MLNLDTGLCFDCFLEQVISEIKEDIEKNGLEETRKAWKEDKPQFERIVREVKEQDSEIGEKFEKAFQEIENLLYPDRKNRGSSSWIWVLVILIVVGVGIVVYFLFRKPKRKSRNG